MVAIEGSHAVVTESSLAGPLKGASTLTHKTEFSFAVAPPSFLLRPHTVSQAEHLSSKSLFPWHYIVYSRGRGLIPSISSLISKTSQHITNFQVKFAKTPPSWGKLPCSRSLFPYFARSTRPEKSY